jgi:hypothetical protein
MLNRGLSDCILDTMAAWKYDPGEIPKIKHHWNRDYADFVEHQGQRIGKCPSTITAEIAEGLLNAGIAYSDPKWDKPYPSRIYAIYNGVVYRAKPTNPGVSYHGFPEFPERIRSLPGRVREQLLKRARELNCEKEVLRWINR